MKDKDVEFVMKHIAKRIGGIFLGIFLGILSYSFCSWGDELMNDFIIQSGILGGMGIVSFILGVGFFGYNIINWCEVRTR